MSRERSMQRLNILTLAAFLVGLAAFIFDSATPAPARMTAETPGWNGLSAGAANTGAIQISLD